MTCNWFTPSPQRQLALKRELRRCGEDLNSSLGKFYRCTSFELLSGRDLLLVSRVFWMRRDDASIKLKQTTRLYTHVQGLVLLDSQPGAPTACSRSFPPFWLAHQMIITVRIFMFADQTGDVLSSFETPCCIGNIHIDPTAPIDTDLSE